MLEELEIDWSLVPPELKDLIASYESGNMSFAELPQLVLTIDKAYQHGQIDGAISQRLTTHYYKVIARGGK